MTTPIKKTYKKSTIIGKTERSEDRASHYVDRKALYEAIVERKRIIAETGEVPRVTEFIGKCILDIATGLAKKYQFIGYSFRDEMISDAVIHCLRYIDSFNPEVSNNPFSYFTQTCYFVFIERIKEEKEQQYVKYVMMLDSAALKEVADQPDQFSGHDINMSELDTTHIAEFVQKYQDGIVVRSNKSKPKKVSTMKTLDDFEESFAPKTEELVEVFYYGNDPNTFIVDEIGLVEEDDGEK